MDLSFNMFDIILARLLRIFENAPDLDSAAHLEETTILSPVVKVFVEWIKSSYQKWFPLSSSLLSAPKEYVAFLPSFFGPVFFSLKSGNEVGKF
jgi:hypothetical protein